VPTYIPMCVYICHFLHMSVSSKFTYSLLCFCYLSHSLYTYVCIYVFKRLYIETSIPFTLWLSLRLHFHFVLFISPLSLSVFLNFPNLSRNDTSLLIFTLGKPNLPFLLSLALTGMKRNIKWTVILCFSG
jgi:hypothetical protein